MSPAEALMRKIRVVLAGDPGAGSPPWSCNKCRSDPQNFTAIAFEDCQARSIRLLIPRENRPDLV